MKKNIYFLFNFSFQIFLFNLTSCNTTEPTSNDNKLSIELDLVDVSCNEAWINVKSKNIKLPIWTYFKVNNSVNGAFQLFTNDTVIYYNGYKPNFENDFRISFSQNFHPDSTVELKFNSLDTTVENYSFSLDTLGSTQSDVTGIWGTSASNLWAVGTFTSIGPTTVLANFNGIYWRYIFPNEFHNSDGIGSGDLEGIYGLDENNIWVVGYRHTPSDSIFGFVGYYNGSNWKNLKVNVPDVIFTDLWVDENKNIWVVGTNGTIMFYDGVSWIQYESGTDFILWDIDAVNSNDIYAAGYASDNSDGVVLHFDGSVWQKIDFFSVTGPMKSVSAISERKIWVVGGTTAVQFDGENWNGYGLIEDNLVTMKGLNYNDIFFGGFEGAINHFNGLRMNKITNTIVGHENSLIKDIFIIGNKVYFAGRGGIGFDQRGLIYTATK